MRARPWTRFLALVAAASAAAIATPRPPETLPEVSGGPPPAPPRAPGPQPLDELPASHWVRPLLAQLRFADGRTPTAPGRTRLDAAVLVARWLERGEPSPAARPRLVASHLTRELAALGLAPAKVRAALARLAPPVSVPAPTTDDTPGRAAAVRRQLTRSLEAHRALEARLEALRSRTRGTTP